MRIGIWAACLGILCAGCGSAPRENVVLRTQTGGDALIVSEAVISVQNGEQHEMILRFNNRKVADTSTDPADTNVQIKLSPENVRVYALINKEAVARAMATPWRVFVSPKSFDDAEFTRLAACYEANRTEIDTALLKPPFTAKRYVERFVHADPPPAPK